jgi:Ca2+-binding EF-hand superfamily protein
VNIKVEATTIDYLEQTLWTRLMQLVDDNGDGTLQKEEFETLMKSLGNAFATDELDNMFSKADEDKNGAVSETELAKYVTQVRQTSGIRFLKQVLASDESYANDHVVVTCDWG